MNAPLRITIDDATKRKADMWEGLDLLSSDELLMIDQALTYYAQSRHLEATERQRDQFRAKHTKRDDALAATLGAESAALRRKAADLSDLQDKITRVSDLYYMPPEEW